MEFHEKLQQLRKRSGLTQEALAEKLYVSRAAVSKWESGRGYPSIDSLKAIAKFYSVTVDALLSGEEILTIAEEEQKEHSRNLKNKVFGLLDLSAVMYLFLPLFGQRQDDLIRSVSLLILEETAPWLKTAYLVLSAGMILWGIRTLLCPDCISHRVSLLLQTVLTLLFILSSQPYAAALGFLFLGMKVFILIKKQ